MSRRSAPRRWARASALVAALTLGAGAPAVGAEIPDSVRSDIQEVLQKKVESLLGEKNDAGQRYRRGAYSQLFRPLDDGRYEVDFQVDTARPTSLLTERYTLTIAGSGDQWSIAEEKLEDSFEGLYRSEVGDEDFHDFDSLSLDIEGLTVTGGRGSLYKDYWRGDLTKVAIAAEGLSIEYTPPTESEARLHDIFRERNKRELNFEPQFVVIRCEGKSCDDLLEKGVEGLRPSSRDTADRDLARSYDDWRKQTEKSRRESPFSSYNRPAEPDHRWYWISVTKKGDEDYALTLTYDDHEPREVAVYLGGFFGALYRYYSEQTRTANVDPHQLEMREDVGARDYDLTTVRGRVSLGVEGSELLEGDLTYELTTKRDLRVIPFRIARLRRTEDEAKDAKNPSMRIDSLGFADGRALTWVKTGAASGLVVLPEEVSKGTDLAFRMQFQNTDSIYKLTPSFSFVDRGGWLPFVRFGDMIDTFEIDIQVPAKYRALGVGQLVDESKSDGVRTTSWTNASPVTFPTVIFGEYVEQKSNVKATHSDGREIPVVLYMDKVGMKQSDIAPKSLEVLVDQAANSLNLFREIYGVDYPFDKLDLVNDPLGFLYGQSPASIVYLGNGAFLSEGLLGSFVGGARGSNITKFTKSLVAHEVAHQWWGGVVTNHSQYHYWFVESLAEYSAALYIEATQGREAYLEHVDAWRREVVESELNVSVQDASVMWTGGFSGYRAAVYSKGPYMFHIMRATWGEDKFFNFLKMLAQGLQGKEIVTRDIQRIAESAFGGSMEWFFDQWIRGVGMPEYKVAYKTRKIETGEYLIEGTIDQTIVVGREGDELPGLAWAARFPVTVEGKKQKYRKAFIIREPSTPFSIKVPEKPRKVLFNSEGEVLARNVAVEGA